MFNSSSQANQSPPLGVVLIPVFLITFSVLAIVGNTIVIIVFRTFPRLRTVTNHFLLSLSVSDILVALVTMPIYTALTIHGTGNTNWNKNPIFIFWTCTDIFLGVASIANLTFISIERCICITWPYKHHRLMHERQAVIIIIFLWLFSASMALIRYLTWTSTSYFNYELFVSISCFFSPVIVMVICYFNIYRVARYQARTIEFPSLKENEERKRFYLSKELKAVRVLSFILGAFMLTWGPFFFYNFISFYTGNPPDTLITSILKCFHFSNSIMNPVIYCFVNKDFKAGLKLLRLRVHSRLGGGTREISTNHSRSTTRRSQINHPNSADETNINEKLTKHQS